jgi:hypothetical protein
VPARLQHPYAWQLRDVRSTGNLLGRRTGSAEHGLSSDEQTFLHQQQLRVSGNGDWNPPKQENGLSPGQDRYPDSNLTYGLSDWRAASHLHSRSG